MSNLRETVERAISKAKCISNFKEVQIHTSYHHEYSSVITNRNETISDNWEGVNGGVVYFRPIIRLEGGKDYNIDEVINYINNKTSK